MLVRASSTEAASVKASERIESSVPTSANAPKAASPPAVRSALCERLFPIRTRAQTPPKPKTSTDTSTRAGAGTNALSTRFSEMSSAQEHTSTCGT